MQLIAVNTTPMRQESRHIHDPPLQSQHGWLNYSAAALSTACARAQFSLRCAEYNAVQTAHAFMQADGNHVEVVATTHATPGVRHLVKAVVRGLKACQVCSRYYFISLFCFSSAS